MSWQMLYGGEGYLPFLGLFFESAAALYLEIELELCPRTQMPLSRIYQWIYDLIMDARTHARTGLTQDVTPLPPKQIGGA